MFYNNARLIWYTAVCMNTRLNVLPKRLVDYIDAKPYIALCYVMLHLVLSKIYCDQKLHVMLCKQCKDKI